MADKGYHPYDPFVREEQDLEKNIQENRDSGSPCLVLLAALGFGIIAFLCVLVGEIFMWGVRMEGSAFGGFIMIALVIWGIFAFFGNPGGLAAILLIFRRK